MFGVLGTPRARIIRETINAWFQLLAGSDSDLINNIRVAWGIAKNLLLSSKSPVTQIKGLMSNIIYILLSAKWSPAQDNRWIDTNGDTWILLDSTASPNVLSAALIKTFFLSDLSTAANHYNGLGIQHGIDFNMTMELHRNYKSHQFQLKCALEAVLSAGLWPAARVHEIHPEVSPICPRCSSAVETCKHTFWECPCNSDIDDYAVVSTQIMCAKALADADSLPCFWLRGIIPQEFTKVDDSYAPPDEPNHTIISNIGEAVWSSGTYYGDASGGEFSSLPSTLLFGVRCGTLWLALLEVYRWRSLR